MTLSRTFPAGVPIPASIHCPDEVVRLAREGRTATATPLRRSSQVALQRQGFKVQAEVPELDPEKAGDVKPGDVTDPVAYQEALASGAITEAPKAEVEKALETGKPKSKATTRKK
jgi:hypothetical protein